MNALVIASSYIAAQMLAGGLCVTQNQPLLNPFIALGYCIFSGNWAYTNYLIFPWIGAIAALVFFELIFVRTLEYLEEDNEEFQDDDKGLELDSDEGEP